MMELLDGAAVSFQPVLTKIDKISGGRDLRDVLNARRGGDRAAHARRTRRCFSPPPQTGDGIAELRAALAGVARPERYEL